MKSPKKREKSHKITITRLCQGCDLLCMFRYNLCIMLQLTRHRQVEEMKKQSFFLLFDLGCCFHCLLALFSFLTLSESFCKIMERENVNNKNISCCFSSSFLISFSLVVFLSFIFMISFHLLFGKT